MEWETDTTVGVTVPWDGQHVTGGAVNEQIACDAVAIANFGDKVQQPDEMLMACGWPRQVMGQWLASDIYRDPLIARARRRSSAIRRMDSLDPRHPLRRYEHTMVQTLTVPGETGRWWGLILSRNGLAFTPYEEHFAGLLLRCWQVGFDQRLEPRLGRLIIGHDDRLIHADPFTALWFTKSSGTLEQLLWLLHPIVNQRWPNLTDDESHDFVVELADELCWVRFRRTRALNVKGAEHWYLEIRELADETLPPVGTLEDGRIARALAYLHDRYHESPKLAEIAQAVQLSPFHFHRLFSEAIGTSPKHYLQGKQLQVAKWRLRCGGESIGSIANSTGFANHGHFTSTFHRIVGVRPTQYRDGHRSAIE